MSLPSAELPRRFGFEYRGLGTSGTLPGALPGGQLSGPAQFQRRRRDPNARGAGA